MEPLTVMLGEFVDEHEVYPEDEEDANLHVQLDDESGHARQDTILQDVVEDDEQDDEEITARRANLSDQSPLLDRSEHMLAPLSSASPHSQRHHRHRQQPQQAAEENRSQQQERWRNIQARRRGVVDTARRASTSDSASSSDLSSDYDDELTAYAQHAPLGYAHPLSGNSGNAPLLEMDLARLRADRGGIPQSGSDDADENQEREMRSMGVWSSLLYSDGEDLDPFAAPSGGGGGGSAAGGDALATVPLEGTVWNASSAGRRVLAYRHGQASNRREFVAACLTVLLNNVGYSVVLPSMWYRVLALGGSEAYLGLCVALFSLGQVLGASALNRLFVYRPRHLHLLLIASLVLLAASELAYAFSTQVWMLLLSRFFSGFGTGNQEVLQSHVTLITKPSLRASRVGQMSFVATVSFLIGPILAGLLTLLSSTQLNLGSNSFPFDETTAPAMLSAALALCALFLLPLFTSHREVAVPVHNETPLISTSEYGNDGPRPWKEMGLMFLLIVSYSLMFNTGGVYEAALVPYAASAYGWTVLASAGFFAVSGFAATLAHLGISWIGMYIHELLLLLPSFALLGTGYALLVANAPMWRFILGSCIIAFAFPAAFHGLVGLYSNIYHRVSPRDVAARMRYLKNGGNAARFFAPLWSTVTLEYAGASVVYGLTSASVLLAALFLLARARRLINLSKLDVYLMSPSSNDY